MVKRALTLLTSILFALPLLMPFNIYGAGETQIVPTYTSSTTQQEWQTKIRITNYCEGTNASTVSCKLSFYVAGNYYGIINIDGYDSSGTHWINGGYVFVSDGYGEYNYNFYQNGIKEINRISIWGVSLFQPDSNVDLTQIIQLLTSINSYAQQNNLLIDEIVDNTDTIEVNQLENINQIKNVISQLIVSNGYLSTLTKLRQFHFPLETYIYQQYFIRQYESKMVNIGLQNIYYDYPVYKLNANDYILNTWYYRDREFYISFMSDINFSMNNFSTYFQTTNCTLEEIVYANFDASIYSMYYKTLKFKADDYLISIKLLSDTKYFMPVYFGDDDSISTDLALQIGVKNEVLKNLDLIANGTTASQSAADSSQSANSQLQTESNTLFQQENGFKSDMQSAMHNVNNTFRLSDMGTKFVSSAQWVRTQYEQLTNNTPFASLITFSLITGLALILLGKVYK